MNKRKILTLLTHLMVILLAQFFTRLPDFIRWQNTPADKWYTGQSSWFDPWDLNVYFSAIGWGKRDGILFENLYDTESVQAMPIYSLYTFLGKAASPFNLSNSFVFHLAGLITNLFLAGTGWWFIKIFLKKEADRKLAFILLFLGGGLGWLFFSKVTLPDIGQPGFTFASAIRRPHEAISLSCFLLALGYLWQGTINQKKSSLIYAGLSSFLMLLFHPYSLVSIGITLACFGFYWYVEKESTYFLKALILLGLAAGVYYFSVGKNLLSNPSFSGLASQVQASPSPIQAILSWGLLFPLIVIALFLKEKDGKSFFLKLWFISHWLIIYLPFGFQKLLIRGLWVPAVILSVKGAREISRKMKWDYYLIVNLLIIFTSFSTLFMTYKRIVESPENRWIYLTKEEGEAIDYLKTYGNNEEGVLASYRIANLIPANTPKRVWLGHPFQTPHFEERFAQAYRFFAGKMEESETKLFLKKTKAVWIFWGPDEKSIANLNKIPEEELLELVFEKRQVTLYKVKE